MGNNVEGEITLAADGVLAKTTSHVFVAAFFVDAADCVATH